MSKYDVYSNPNEKRPKSQKTIQTKYKPKSQKKLTFFFGPDEYYQPNNEQRLDYFSKQNFQKIRTHGFRKTTHNHLKMYHPIAEKVILILGFPLFMLGILIAFLVAVICTFFMGIFIMVRDSFEQFGCFFGIILLPATILVGAIGATFFPWVFKDYIIQIHYEFWFEFAEDYFHALCTICS